MSSSEITVRPYQPGDEDGILRLFNQVFREGDPGYRGRGMDHWRWEFLQNPAGTQVVLGIEPGGRIVSQYACLPARVHLRGADVCCGQGIDSVLHPDYRRGLKREGAFLKVAKFYFDHYGVPGVNAFGYGFPNKKAYRIGVKLLDYKPIAVPVQTSARNLFNFKHDREVGAGQTSEGEIIEIDRWDERLDDLWRRIEPTLPMTIKRTAAYLNWRYADCPSVTYRMFALTAGGLDLRAAWVLRPNWMGPPILALCELIAEAKDTPALARALAHSVQFARDNGQPRVEMWIPPTSPIFDAVRERGFKVEDSPFNLCIKIYDPALDAAWARAHWFYTIGDSDVF